MQHAEEYPIVQMEDSRQTWASSERQVVADGAGMVMCSVIAEMHQQLQVSHEINRMKA